MLIHIYLYNMYNLDEFDHDLTPWRHWNNALDCGESSPCGRKFGYFLLDEFLGKSFLCYILAIFWLFFRVSHEIF